MSIVVCAVVTRDEKLDELNHEAQSQVIERMAKDPDQLRGYLNLILLAVPREGGRHATILPKTTVYSRGCPRYRHPSSLPRREGPWQDGSCLHSFKHGC